MFAERFVIKACRPKFSHSDDDEEEEEDDTHDSPAGTARARSASRGCDKEMASTTCRSGTNATLLITASDSNDKGACVGKQASKSTILSSDQTTLSKLGES